MNSGKEEREMGHGGKIGEEAEAFLRRACKTFGAGVSGR